MKKIASILFIILAMMSCSQEITRNNPSVQGLKDGVLWRANGSHGVLHAPGYLEIVGVTQFETLTLTTSSFMPGTYLLGTSNSSTAEYEYSQGNSLLQYTTGTGIGDGQIVITDYDEEGHTVTGTFRFNAENTDDNSTGGEILNYQQGVFYNIPVVPAGL